MSAGLASAMPARTRRSRSSDEGPSYAPRRPEETVLYQVVAQHLEAFLARAEQRDRRVPCFVARELRGFLDCGILARGFLRAHCDASGAGARHRDSDSDMGAGRSE